MIILFSTGPLVVCLHVPTDNSVKSEHRVAWSFLPELSRYLPCRNLKGRSGAGTFFGLYLISLVLRKHSHRVASNEVRSEFDMVKV